MTLLRLVRRSLVDLLDPVILITTALFLYLMNFFLLVPVQSALVEATVQYLSTGSFVKSAVVFFSSLGLIGWLALLLSLIIYLYLLGLVAARILQVRRGKSSNPFKTAVSRMLAVFAALALISSVPFLFMLLYLFYSPLPFSTVLFWLMMLSAFTWSMMFLPALAAVVDEGVKGRHMIYEGILAGRVFWWKAVIALLLLGVLAYLILILLNPFNLPLALFLYNLVVFLSIPVVAAESYSLFKEGS